MIIYNPFVIISFILSVFVLFFLVISIPWLIFYLDDGSYRMLFFSTLMKMSRSIILSDASSENDKTEKAKVIALFTES